MTCAVEGVDVDGVVAPVVETRILQAEAGVGDELNVLPRQRKKLALRETGEHCSLPVTPLKHTLMLTLYQNLVKIVDKSDEK